MPQNVVHIE